MSDQAAMDTKRAIAASKAIFDNRNPRHEYSAILVTLEHTVAVSLLAMFPDPAMAAKMLNEGLLPGVEDRLSFYASKGQRR